jgi:hypothetical protein
MTRRFTYFFALLALTAGFAPGQGVEAATPAPTASLGTGPRLNLSGALPSPTPDRTLPAMKPEIAGSFIFYEDFEKGAAKWTPGIGKSGIGFHLLKAATCGGLYTMVLGEAKNPPTSFAREDVYLTLKAPIDLRKVKKAQLQYDLKGDVSPPDSATIIAEMRAVGGTWKPVAPKATARFPLVVTFTGELDAYLGKQVELRFHGVTRPAKQAGKGFYLDDVHVVRALM